MTAPTHLTFAEFIYLLLLTTTGIALDVTNAITVGLSSLLPDIDTGASTVGRALPFLSGPIERRFGHRTLTHSLLFCCVLALVCSPVALLEADVYFCLVAGYVSHPFLDTMNVNGIRLFYP
ncbi:metal-dependent hydrolase, partial [bacterium]|nr:metal-dependent hydrolase [bacterium]